jgi:putative endonuclease
VYFVYVLKSQKYKRIYIGSTSDLRERVSEHNKGRVKATKYGIPWILVYYEAFLSERDALGRELHLKKYGSALGFLKRRIKRSLDRV